MIQIDLLGNYFTVTVGFSDNDLARAIPHRAWSERERAWLAPRTRMVAEYFRDRLMAFHPRITEKAQAEFDRILSGAQRMPARAPKVLPRTTPYQHQADALRRGQDMKNFAYIMDPGTGKTKVLIDEACEWFARGAIDGLIVITPNSVTSNWADETAVHCALPFDVYVYDPGKKAQAGEWARKGMPGMLKVFVMACESLSHESAAKALDAVLDHNRCGLAVDESHRFKTESAKLSKNLRARAPRAVYRRLATGTHITKGLQDAWSQFEILHHEILGMDWIQFRNHFCIVGGHTGRQIVASQNEAEFIDLVTDFVYMARKEDCLDLPEKVYQTRKVQPTPQQARMLLELARCGITQTETGGSISYTVPVVRDLRLQQITGGFTTSDKDLASVLGDATAGDFDFADPAAFDAAIQRLEQRLERAVVEPIPDGNPKVDEVLRIAEDIPGKIIIWCRFKPEIAAVVEALGKAYGPRSVVQFHGDVDKDERTEARRRFQNDDTCRFFVGQPDSGGIGITLTAASTVVYFSNSWRLDSRIQSEDRAHRIGQTKNVLYIDLVLVAPEKYRGKLVDTKVLLSLKAKKDYAVSLLDELQSAVG